ncbi:MAG TPA: hypothetical protein VI386_18255 [Candidatus Sulfotelmatobacter sp.]
MWQKYKGVILFAILPIAILWIAVSYKSDDSHSPSLPNSQATENTPQMRALLVEKLNQDSQLRNRLMTKEYVNLVSLDDVAFGAAEGDSPIFVVYSDLSKIRGFKDDDPGPTSLLCIWMTGMIDQATLRKFGFRQIVLGDAHHHITCQVSAQLNH